MQHHLFISFDFIVIETIQKKNQSNNCIKQYCTHFLYYDPIPKSSPTTFEKSRTVNEIYLKKGMTLNAKR